MLKYLRYLGIYLFAGVTTLVLALGGGWMWLGVGFVYLPMTFGAESVDFRTHLIRQF